VAEGAAFLSGAEQQRMEGSQRFQAEVAKVDAWALIRSGEAMTNLMAGSNNKMEVAVEKEQEYQEARDPDKYFYCRPPWFNEDKSVLERLAAKAAVAAAWIQADATLMKDMTKLERSALAKLERETGLQRPQINYGAQLELENRYTTVTGNASNYDQRNAENLLVWSTPVPPDSEIGQKVEAMQGLIQQQENAYLSSLASGDMREFLGSPTIDVAAGMGTMSTGGYECGRVYKYIICIEAVATESAADVDTATIAKFQTACLHMGTDFNDSGAI
jgi:hypothetical protein